MLHIKLKRMTHAATYVGHPIKNETFFYSTVNLHARLMKSRSKLACLFGYSHEPYSLSYTVPTFDARQH